MELVEVLFVSKFAGLSYAQQGDSPRVLYLRPSFEQYKTVKAQLEELEREGALSFVEQLPPTPNARDTADGSKT